MQESYNPHNFKGHIKKIYTFWGKKKSPRQFDIFQSK